jgi:hypothetical protein
VDASESRLTTIGMGCFAATTVALFAAVYAPTLSAVAPGSAIRPPMSILPALLLWFAMIWWMPCIVMGVRQLFVSPRRYGLFTIGFGVLQFAAYQLTEWLLMGSRGIYWAD